LNIDGCRVLYEEGDDLKGKVFQVNKDGVYGGNSLLKSKTKGSEEGTPAHSKGRWPPNLLLTHSQNCGEECAEDCPVREIDEQSGITKGGYRANPSTNTRPPFADKAQTVGERGYKGDGGASRYFPVFKYCAKPSKSEKNQGLDSMPIRANQKLNSGGIQGRRDAKAEQAIEQQQGLDGRGRTLIREDGSKTLVERFIPGYSANSHPTVKSIELMRWLVRLVTPKIEGKTAMVLDCFVGSGTTGCAAAMEGFNFVGIDLNPHFVELSKLRFQHWQRQSVCGARLEDVDQGLLFG